MNVMKTIPINCRKNTFTITEIYYQDGLFMNFTSLSGMCLSQVVKHPSHIGCSSGSRMLSIARRKRSTETSFTAI